MTARALPLLALFAFACNSNVVNAPSGEFNAPGGIAATGAGDRDLLFIANSGRDSLRALQLCNAPLLADGGLPPGDTCPSNENGQFIPAPIRVFPAAIETGDLTMRVAGVRLTGPDGTAAGVALAVGAGSTVAVVDARSLLAAQATAGVAPKPVIHWEVGDRTVDVVAANPLHPDLDVEVPAGVGATVPVFVATASELLVLDVGLDTSGSVAQVPPIRGRCTLAPVAPRRIAVVPGSGDKVYVADGAGDGVVSIDAATITITGGACTMHRISAGGRSVRSVSVSPRWYDENGPHGPGDLLLMMVEPLAVTAPGTDPDPGGVLFAATGTESPEGIFPIPPFPLSDTTSERMQPLSLAKPGLLLDGAFLRSVKARPSPVSPDLTACTSAPCTPLYVGAPTTAPTQLFGLLAAVTSTDGSTSFLDVPKRRLVNQSLYNAPGDASLPPVILTPVYNGSVTGGPVLFPDPSTAEPGVAHDSTWTANWHARIPGLERRSGIVTPTGTGTLLFTPTSVDFTVWQNDPAIALGAGDVVSFATYSLAGDTSAACQEVLSSEKDASFRFELPIANLSPGALELGELADTSSGRGFHPDGCLGGFGVVAEVRTGGSRPWLVFERTTVRGRVEPDGTFVARQRRFDYPRSSYSAGPPPQASSSNDVAFKFVIVGSGTAPNTWFQWSVSSSSLPVSYNDSFAVGGFATSVYGYSSPRRQSLVFTSITGGNEVLQADPALLSSNATTGLVAYR